MSEIKDIYIYILQRYIFISISICIIIKSIQWNMIPVYREFIYLCVNIDAVPRHIIVQIGNVCSCNLANKRHVKALFDACLSYANMSVKRRRCCNSCVLASQSERLSYRYVSKNTSVKLSKQIRSTLKIPIKNPQTATGK